MLLCTIGYMSILTRIVNTLESLDMFVFMLLSLGGAWPGETISGASYRAERNGTFMRVFRKPIDFLFSLLGQKEHCRSAYNYAIRKGNLPEDMR